MMQVWILKPGDKGVCIGPRLRLHLGGQSRRRFLHDPPCAVAQHWIGHRFVNKAMPSQGARIGQIGMRTVQHSQFAHLVRGHVIHPLNARPVGARTCEIILDHPFGKGLGWDGHRVLGLCSDSVSCGRRDPVNHAGWEGHWHRDRQVRGLGESGHGGGQLMAIVGEVVAGQDRHRCRPIRQSPRQSPNRGQSATVQIIADGRTVQVKRTIRREVIPLFRDGQSDQARVGTGDFTDHGGWVLGHHQHVVDAVDPFNHGPSHVLDHQCVSIALRRQTIPYVRRSKANACDLPTRAGLRVPGLMGAKEVTDAEVQNTRHHPSNLYVVRARSVASNCARSCAVAVEK
mmetsp:Transcript_29721/g.59055  ORF Transcript_29721/g.59055 Transcript_29721/m.59055 type:complete len:343 (-) Transcript_29721:936-1964(-)